MPRYKGSPRHKKRYNPVELSSSSSPAVDDAVLAALSPPNVIDLEESLSKTLPMKEEVEVCGAEAEVDPRPAGNLAALYSSMIDLDNESQTRKQTAIAVLDAVSAQYRAEYAAMSLVDQHAGRRPPSARAFDRALARHDMALFQASEVRKRLEQYRKDYDVLDLLGL